MKAIHRPNALVLRVLAALAVACCAVLLPARAHADPVSSLSATLAQQQNRAFAQDDAIDGLHQQQAEIQQIIAQQLVGEYETRSPVTNVGSMLAAGGMSQMLAAEALNNQERSYLRDLIRESEDLDASVLAASNLRDADLAKAAVTAQKLDAAQARAAAADQARAAKRAAAKARNQARQQALRTGLAALQSSGFASTGGTTVNALTEPSMLMLAATEIGATGNFSAVTPSSIDVYLAGKQSPMTGSGVYFVAAGAQYGIDPRLLVAIAGAESNFGSQTCAPYNAWGWNCPDAPVTFANWGQAIETIAQGLAANYIDQGLTSVAQIQQKWAPSNAANDPTGLNSHWTANVTKFLLEQGGNPFAIATAPSAAPSSGAATPAPTESN